MNFRILSSRAVPVVGMTLLVAGCSKKPDHDPRTDPPLVIIAPVKRAAGTQRGFTGIVTAKVQSDLGFRVAGKITERLVDVGQRVRRGQPLLRLDPNDLSLAVNARDADVEAARARWVQAAADEARLRGLIKAGAISAQAYDLAKATADSAQAQFSAAQAQAKVARNSNEYAELVADADGVVVSTLAEPGQVVGNGQVVIRLAAAGPREASINLPESLRPALGSTADAILYGSDESKPFPVHLRQISDSADVQTRTFEARYVLDGEAADAPLGSTVTIRLTGGNEASTTVVPVGAIYDPGHQPGVWVLDSKGSTVVFRSVKVGQLGEEDAVVTSGLQVGEPVVALGAHLLHAGQRVRVASPQEGAK